MWKIHFWLGTMAVQSSNGPEVALVNFWYSSLKENGSIGCIIGNNLLHVN